MSTTKPLLPLVTPLIAVVTAALAFQPLQSLDAAQHTGRQQGEAPPKAQRVKKSGKAVHHKHHRHHRHPHLHRHHGHRHHHARNCPCCVGRSVTTVARVYAPKRDFADLWYDRAMLAYVGPTRCFPFQPDHFYPLPHAATLYSKAGEVRLPPAAYNEEVEVIGSGGGK